MSYQEKRTVVSLITGVLVLAAYFSYVSGKVPAGALDAQDLKFWARTMLIFIGIGVGASIVIQIVFHILMSIGIAVKKAIRNESVDDKEIERSINSEMVEDEMGKLIELKSSRVGFFFAGIGLIAALVSVLLGYSAALMLNIIFASFSVGSILEGFAQLYYFRKGV